ncbi:hypothetical protein CH63R_03159 [Colletotrichum higginsianum IMI 349063]|uniref:Uncharacterized protein n=2 Tax=Colletotrichum higginsianum (strain IMI 349063) TaxID=759273 RepID=A0A1B7YQY4_COLHI|nr:hypothetical protein CH63R_03159 [Colletotrichum higginsianum IMI 349063]OBR14433.1 hypothetical protein CH63R_03159 [Colletotrichum higginsianum IMI 349063]
MLSAKVQRRDNNNDTNKSIDDAMRHPNATGSWPIHGVDVTKPLRDPPSDEYGRGNGWTIDIAVATNITITESESRFNIRELNLKVPDNAFSGTYQTVNATEHYDVCSCMWWGNRWSSDDMEKFQQNADGSCNGVIPESCIAYVRETLSGGLCNRPASYKTPEGCHALAPSFAVTASMVLRANKSTYGIGRNWGLYTDGSEELAAYDHAVTNVFPVMLLYKYDDGEVRSNYTVFRCVRANQIAEGSRQPEAFGDRRGSAGVFGVSMFSLFTGLVLCLMVTSLM